MSQDSTEFQEIPCQDCIYSARCMDKLNWHIDNAHNESEIEQSNIQNLATFVTRGTKLKVS